MHRLAVICLQKFMTKTLLRRIVITKKKFNLNYLKTSAHLINKEKIKLLQST